jgi:hypothetical protein
MADATKINHRHDDGRACTLGADGDWRYWEAPGPMAGRLCMRVHPSHEDRRVDLDDCDKAERGEFGMPTLGVHDMPKFDLLMERAADTSPWSFTVGCGGVSYECDGKGWAMDAVTHEARVVLELLPAIMQDFLESNEKYARAQTGHDLGAKGVIPDINRKTSALITRIWDGVEAGRDETDELIGDLIGHLLLLLAKRNA